MRAFSSSTLARLFSTLRDEKGAAMLAQLVVSFLITVAAATGLVRAVWEAHESTLREYRRARVLEEVQAELEYWKAQLFIKGPSAPSPSARNTVVLDRGKRRSQEYILGEYEPAPRVTQLVLPGTHAYEITVTLSWPDGGVTRKESLRTAINQMR